MKKSPSYLVRWKAEHMIFWRWTFTVCDFVIKRNLDGGKQATQSEYMVLMTKRGARKEIPYGNSCFLFSPKRAKVIEQRIKEKEG